ncbi:MAG TPA: hypothetical protein VMX54_21365 [Vicinamibacteria bacterium]|nr:hypothetical protein [Vicinamibacteria bacterium]
MAAPSWYTVAEVAQLLHCSRLAAWRALQPHRAQCHLARRGQHPRLHLWAPASVVQLVVQRRRQRGQ